MKKILFLFLLFIIKLNAYDFMYWDSNVEGGSGIYQFFIDSNGQLKNKIVYKDGRVLISDKFFYTDLSYMRNTRVYTGRYVTNETFINYYKNNLDLLNAFYEQKPNEILNYFYNENIFTNGNYIEYNDYELLYNSDGFAVASIVNDQWAGLYDNETRFASGKLYDKSGTLQYINGKAVKQMSPFDMINELFIVSVQEIFGLMSRTMCYMIGVLVVLVFAAFLFVLDLLHSSLSKVERLGSPWIATFDEKGKRVSKWGKNPNYFYHSSFNGSRGFNGWRDYTEYERKLSDDSSSSNFRKKVF